MKKMNIVIFGLSITSSWGNAHAAIFRNLVKALRGRGHKITFFEKDVPWYAAHRDMPNPPFCNTILYQSLQEIDSYEAIIAQADLVILGSYVTDAALLAKRVAACSPTCFAFYDIDTPVTLAKLRSGDTAYLTPDMIHEFDIYFSFTGGPTLIALEQVYGAQRARPLYCSIDPDIYFPETDSTATTQRNYPPEFALGYLGAYSDDSQSKLNKLLIEPALRNSDTRFCVAGAQYPETIQWPDNVKLIEHIPPHQHRHFYNSQRFTLNITRRGLIHTGYSPSLRIFEAGACSTPVISDHWEGLDSFFVIGEEILVANDGNDVLEFLNMHHDDRRTVGRRMWEKVLSAHTSTHRAIEIENYWHETLTAPAIAVNS